jgi:hypothetical protein
VVLLEIVCIVDISSWRTVIPISISIQKADVLRRLRVSADGGVDGRIGGCGMA